MRMTRNHFLTSFIIVSFVLMIWFAAAYTMSANTGSKRQMSSANNAQAASITLTGPRDGASVSISNRKIQGWWDHYKRSKARKSANKKEKTRPDPLTLSWKAAKGTASSYTVVISRSADLSRPIIVKTKKTSLNVWRLERNRTYYWQVKGRAANKTIQSAIHHFYTKDCARVLKVGGVKNIRDLGGYKTADGRRIRQGMVYRSARLDYTTKKGKKILKKSLKIKTDLDLRKKGEGGAGKKSPVLKRYIHIHGLSYSKLWKRKYKKVMVREMRVFTKPSNYPIIFHCSYGRDRTGALAFMLNGLLGASKRDLYKDYELTFFSGCSGSKSAAKRKMKRFDKMYKHMSRYKDSSKPLSYNIEAYLLDRGMKQSEIDAIKKIMLE